MSKKDSEVISLAKYKGLQSNCIDMNTVRDWLRTHHKLHVSVNVYADEKQGKVIEFYETNIVDVKDDWNTFAVNSFYEDYDLALKEVLIHALKKIDI